MNSSIAAKLRFLAVYLLSVGFIVVIVGMLMGTTGAPATTSVSTVAVADNELWEANKYLHGRIAELNGLYAASLKDPARRYTNAAGIQKAETAFTASLDSVQQRIGNKETSQQPAWEEMVIGFRQGVEGRKNLLQAYLAQPQPTAASPAIDAQQLADLQAQVQQRDATIADLNRQLANRSTTAPSNSSGNTELTKTNASLRASLEKARAENEALNRSYKAVIDDHKRVLAQLQAARKQ